MFKKHLIELGKRYIIYIGTKMRMTEDFLLETKQARRQWSDGFKVLKEKDY